MYYPDKISLSLYFLMSGSVQRPAAVFKCMLKVLLSAVTHATRLSCSALLFSPPSLYLAAPGLRHITTAFVLSLFPLVRAFRCECDLNVPPEFSINPSENVSFCLCVRPALHTLHGGNYNYVQIPPSSPHQAHSCMFAWIH